MSIAALEPPNRIDTRDRILDATDRLMQRYGFRKMTMDDIAREAGVSKRTIYTHFANKEEVGLFSIDRVVRFAHRRMEDAAAGPGGAPQRLQRMLEERVIARVESVRDYRQSLDELFEAVRPAYLERRKRNFEIEATLIGSMLQAGAAEGAFEVDDAERMAEQLLRATNAYLPYSLSVAELGDLEAIRSGVSDLAGLLIRGLRPMTIREDKP